MWTIVWEKVDPNRKLRKYLPNTYYTNGVYSVNNKLEETKSNEK